MKKSIYFMMLGTCGALALQAMAQETVTVTEVEVIEVVELIPEKPAPRFAIKGYDNIGLGKAMQVTEAQPGQTAKSNYNSFGLDFGYTFWNKGPHSLEANIGVGYTIAHTTFGIDDMSYHYDAPAYADEDGNEYIRYYELSDLSQRANLGYFNIPLYLEYQYKPLRWLGIHAEVGFNFGFRCMGTFSKTYGKAKAWGVFPIYDDLLIDQDYLDDFGIRTISNSSRDKSSCKGFNGSVMCGAGFEFYAAEPVSFELGVRYNAAVTNSFTGKYNITSTGEYTAETAPVTYTVKDGTQMKPLGDYTTKSKLSPLSLHLGINVRF